MTTEAPQAPRPVSSKGPNGDAPTDSAAPQTPSRPLSPEAARALAEAESRRAEIDARARAVAEQPETAGRGGPEPVRYGDWEIKGLASDF